MTATKRRKSGAAKRGAKGHRTYFQGDRPLRFSIRQDAVTVVRDGHRPFVVAKPDRVWIGDNGDKLKGYAAKGKFARGALLAKKGNTYTYVGGNDVLTFTTTDEIESFHSPMGNGIVPYPYAVGQRNTYLLSDQSKKGIAYFKNTEDTNKKTDPNVKLAPHRIRFTSHLAEP